MIPSVAVVIHQHERSSFFGLFHYVVNFMSFAFGSLSLAAIRHGF